MQGGVWSWVGVGPIQGGAGKERVENREEGRGLVKEIMMYIIIYDIIYNII